MPHIHVAAALILCAASPPPDDAEHSVLVLPEALVLALERSPDLAAFSWDIRAAEARRIQAGVRPNPELAVEIEDIRLGRGPGTATSAGGIGWSPDGPSFQVERESERGGPGGFGEAEFTVSLSQVIELGGKRAKRLRLADRDREAAAWDYEVARADVAKSVAQAFVEVLVAQRRMALDEELVRLAEDVAGAVATRVDAGRVSPLESTKAETSRSLARVQANGSKRALESARAALAALWGDKEARFERAAGDLETVREVPAWDALVGLTCNSPYLERWHAEIEKRRAAIDLERGRRLPDLTASVGFRTRGVSDRAFRGFGLGSDGISFAGGQTRTDNGWEHSLVLGFSIPLPVFDRNQGSIAEAEALAAKAGEERRAAEMRLLADLAASYHSVSAAFVAATTLVNEILPAATQTFESVREAYRQGKFGYLDVLDAQRTLFEARGQYLDALTIYHEDVAEIERVIGESLWTAEATRSSGDCGPSMGQAEDGATGELELQDAAHTLDGESLGDKK